ncbi:hypothetical protein F4560_001040 [Saccharothrix ecbatanensis]|uniref:Uncharacterized protein n=1 Tax=Saccharothrix ecbatanensis TaxID=1105145 RepID=A0A7W9HFF1_9PSEU|nr:hypothetical protein [Saccharothrix ecbatanensis]MBB5801272.1 hypothetical protein [Saccharothrix ecbatanensis]
MHGFAGAAYEAARQSERGVVLVADKKDVLTTSNKSVYRKEWTKLGTAFVVHRVFSGAGELEVIGCARP